MKKLTKIAMVLTLAAAFLPACGGGGGGSNNNGGNNPPPPPPEFAPYYDGLKVVVRPIEERTLHCGWNNDVEIYAADFYSRAEGRSVSLDVWTWLQFITEELDTFEIEGLTVFADGVPILAIAGGDIVELDPIEDYSQYAILAEFPDPLMIFEQPTRVTLVADRLRAPGCASQDVRPASITTVGLGDMNLVDPRPATYAQAVNSGSNLIFGDNRSLYEFAEEDGPVNPEDMRQVAQYANGADAVDENNEQLPAELTPATLMFVPPNQYETAYRYAWEAGDDS